MFKIPHFVQNDQRQKAFGKRINFVEPSGVASPLARYDETKRHYELNEMR